MAELVAGFLGPVIEVVAPIKDQFDYLRRFNNNIQNLRDEAGKLDDAKKGLQMQVDRAKDNLHIILPEVETWLVNSEEMKNNKDIILDEVSNVGSGFMTLRARFCLSKRAKRTVDQMKELRDQLCKFSIISQPPPPPATLALPQETPMEFESRKYFEEEIMETLRCMELNMIGICGMGGVGKTTMAKKIMNRAREEHLCDEVVIVVVSQHADNLRIQLEIGMPLGLVLEKESPQSRAQKLHARLSGPKRTLLVLDDVWRRLNLDDLGIPCGSGCKILVTSRNRDVLSAMDMPKISGLQILTDEEAWLLFRKKAGICVDATDLKSVAEKVVKECRGLPIALATVGPALKDENRLSIWEDALGQLAKANPLDIPNVIADVYNPLKLSYDFLSDSNAKSIFLLCCMFREDDNIPVEHLTWFAMGLRIFGGIWGLEETRNRVCQLIKTLKNRFLLLDGRDEYHVRMHDVIRDVCIFIAWKKGLINCNDCEWVSSYVEGRPRLLVESIFPHLHLVFVDNRLEPEFQINESFIERTGELHVMFIERSILRSIPSLPHKMQLLKNLVTLVVCNCRSLETISDVGHLVSLEILIFRECKLAVEELPVELRALKRLRLLEVSFCRISKLAPGVISSLVALEELKLMESFLKWEADVEGKERENAGLEELEALTNLRCLEIQVLNSRLAIVQLRLSPNLVKFNVKFGLCGVEYLTAKIYHKKLYLEFSAMKNFWGDLSTNTFMRSTEYLHADGLCYNAILKLGKAQNVKSLCVDEFENIKNITEPDDCRSVAAVFPLLECLSLKCMNSLEEIWDCPNPSNSFKNLKQLRLAFLPRLKQLWRIPNDNINVVPIFTNLSSVYISSCDALGHVFSPATKDFHLQLERIEIENCDVMEHVVLVQNVEGEETTELEEGSRITIFPKLKSMSIWYLPKLMSICKGTERIVFPELAEMEIKKCQSMNCLVSTASLDDHSRDHYHDLDSTHLFCEPKVSFCNLKSLTMDGISNKNAWCDQVPSCFFRGLEQLTLSSYCNIKSLLSSSVSRNLVNLQRMNIINCGEMVKVIEDMCDDRAKRLFPRLQYLLLHRLPKLESFCEWRCALELPSLKNIHTRDCPELRNFNAAGSIITPALLSITIDSQKYLSKEDMNDVLQQHFAEELMVRERKAKEVRKRKAIQEQGDCDPQESEVAEDPKHLNIGVMGLHKSKHQKLERNSE